jgi:hypothetical protein
VLAGIHWKEILDVCELAQPDREGKIMAMNVSNLKLWPHLTIVAVICAVVAGVGVGWWVKHEQTASAKELPNAARIQRIDGEVALNNSAANTASADDNWVAATPNQPFSVGDRIYTRENSHASLAFTGRNFARLNPNTSLDVLSLSDQRTQLALRDGSAMFDVGYLAPGELFEVATPYGAVDFQQPGLYNVGIDNRRVLVSVLSGLAQVVGLGGSGQISKGEMLTLLGQTAADVVLSRIDGRNAGYLVDDYYGYQYPRYYDGRYRDYNAYLSDPYYFDPYRRTNSYQYVNSSIPGLYDLDYYGDWQNLNGYGYAWSPRVDYGWSPYQQGYWMTDYPYGPTWVSYEPWGYAPYHYGRWAFVNNQWFWVPDRLNVDPYYSPALVAFIPFGQNEIGWVPLAPGDPYAPRYYYDDWQPYYFTRTQIVQTQVANLYVPNAVTVVQVDDFSRGFDWRRARRADKQMLASVNPVLDPLTFTPLRNAVVHSAWGRGKIALPPGIAKKLQDTTVVTSTMPVSPPFRKDLARTMRVEAVNNRAGNRGFKVKDERQGAQSSTQAPEQVRPIEPKQSNDQLRRSDQGGAKREQQRIDNEMRRVQAERAARAAQQQPQGERVGRPARSEVRRERVRPPAARREPGNVRVMRPSQPTRTVVPDRPTRQPQPRAMERSRRPEVKAQPQPIRQPQPRATERPRRPEVQAQPQPMRQPQPKAMERPSRPANVQGPPPQQAPRVEARPGKASGGQPGRPAAPSTAPAGKGKGKKP